MPTLALSIWPLIAMGLCAGLGPQRGIIWSVVAGYLFLPDGFALNISGLPSYSKTEAVAIGALLGLLITRNRLPPLPATSDATMRFLIIACLVLLVLGPVVTMMANTTPIFFGPTMLKGIGLWDVQGTIVVYVFMFTPFLLAWRYLSTPEMHVEILRAILLLGLFYSLPTLFELRMSPQLNNMVYGYFPHYWMQHLRGGGYRPLVFLDHGLSLGFFLLMTVLAAVGLIKAYGKEKRAFYLLSGIWMFVVLAISHNLGALALGLLFVPAMLVLSARLQVTVAAVVAMLFLANPLIRDVYVVPLLGVSKVISQERHDSLKTRFDNEQTLLDRVNLKPITGWGPWSRWRIHDEFGRDVTISDGTWIITLGKWGWLGFLGLFGLMSLPILMIRRARRRRNLTYPTAALALITAANLIYLIPNSTLSPITWLCTGALAGFVQFIPRRDTDADERVEEDPGRRRAMAYSRFGPRDGDGGPRARPMRPGQTGAGPRSSRA